MDIKELDKKQLILLTLLITFVVSIATGIITVSLMNQMPKTVPQTINNVIQRTIEKVTTVEVPAKVTDNKQETKQDNFVGNNDTLISIYPKDLKEMKQIGTEEVPTTDPAGKPVTDGIIFSETGLILSETIALEGQNEYRVVLDNNIFVATVFKKFNNGFTILKISPIDSKVDQVDTNKNPQ